jgi:hypothetical protein
MLLLCAVCCVCVHTSLPSGWLSGEAVYVNRCSEFTPSRLAFERERCSRYEIVIINGGVVALLCACDNWFIILLFLTVFVEIVIEPSRLSLARSFMCH